MARVVRTSPFAAYRICFDKEGTLWALGRDLRANTAQGDSPHNVLRQYDRGGRLIRQVLPSDSFPAGPQHPALKGLLAVAGDRVAIYSTTRGEWIEISTASGKVLGRWAAPDSQVSGASMTPNGSAYLSFQERRPAVKRTRFCRLDRGTGRWLPVEPARAIGPDESRFALIYGTDGERLLIGLDLPHFVWVRPQ